MSSCVAAELLQM